jgi:hypothetical protein
MPTLKKLNISFVLTKRLSLEKAKLTREGAAGSPREAQNKN